MRTVAREATRVAMRVAVRLVATATRAVMTTVREVTRAGLEFRPLGPAIQLFD